MERERGVELRTEGEAVRSCVRGGVVERRKIHFVSSVLNTSARGRGTASLALHIPAHIASLVLW